MSDNNSVFDDIMQGLNEIEEYQKGNLQLKSTLIDIPDDEIEFYGKFRKLSESNKRKAMEYIDKMLLAN